MNIIPSLSFDSNMAYTSFEKQKVGKVIEQTVEVFFVFPWIFLFPFMEELNGKGEKRGMCESGNLYLGGTSIEESKKKGLRKENEGEKGERVLYVTRQRRDMREGGKLLIMKLKKREREGPPP